MAILHSCCFWKSVRKGSYASAIYTLVYFGSSCIIVANYLHSEQEYLSGKVDRPQGESFLEKEVISYTTIVLEVLLLICSSCGVAASILLFLGLKCNKKEFLLPWIAVMVGDLSIEFFHLLHLLIKETLDFDPLTSVLLTSSLFIICLNVYSFLCVISQYQEYQAGRGHEECSRQVITIARTPPITAPTTLLSTFRQTTKGAISPLMCHNTNFSMIPEEIPQTNGGLAYIQATQAIPLHPLGTMFKKKHVQFPDDENSRRYTSSRKIMPSNPNGNGRILIDPLPEDSENDASIDGNPLEL